MRVSVDVNDVGYVSDASGYRVFLDDVELTGCVTADSGLSMVEVYETDCKGELLIEGGKLKTKIRYGKVDVIDLWETKYYHHLNQTTSTVVTL